LAVQSDAFAVVLVPLLAEFDTFAVEFVRFAVEFVTLALSFVALATELDTFEIQLGTFALEFVIIELAAFHRKVNYFYLFIYLFMLYKAVRRLWATCAYSQKSTGTYNLQYQYLHIVN